MLLFVYTDVVGGVLWGGKLGGLRIQPLTVRVVFDVCLSSSHAFVTSNLDADPASLHALTRTGFLT